MRSLMMLAAILLASPAMAAPTCESKPVVDGSVHGIRAVDVPIVPGMLVTKITPDSPGELRRPSSRRLDPRRERVARRR